MKHLILLISNYLYGFLKKRSTGNLIFPSDYLLVVCYSAFWWFFFAVLLNIWKPFDRVWSKSLDFWISPLRYISFSIFSYSLSCRSLWAVANDHGLYLLKYNNSDAFLFLSLNVLSYLQIFIVFINGISITSSSIYFCVQ